jgi:hypothetical protein
MAAEIMLSSEDVFKAITHARPPRAMLLLDLLWLPLILEVLQGLSMGLLLGLLLRLIQARPQGTGRGIVACPSADAARHFVLPPRIQSPNAASERRA